MATRNRSVDAARGLLILYIVAVIHGTFWLGLLATPLAPLLLFEMPCLFVVSGYAYGLATQAAGPAAPGRRRSAYLRFLAGRAYRILVPYYGYAIPCLVGGAAGGGGGRGAGAVAAAWLNPFRAGAGASVGMLDWHLWFIPTFLAVTALLPALAAIRVRPRLPLWLWAAAATAAISLLRPEPDRWTGAAAPVVVYAIWAVFGYHLSRPEARPGPRELVAVLALSVAALAGSRLARPRPFTLNMQANKFPPNAAFFLFGCAWIALFLLAAPRLGAQRAGRLAESAWLRPFVAYGYTLYLWQGLGYTAAAALGRRWALPVPAVWACALLLTLALGRLASPLERSRLRA